MNQVSHVFAHCNTGNASCLQYVIRSLKTVTVKMDLLLETEVKQEKLHVHYTEMSPPPSSYVALNVQLSQYRLFIGLFSHLHILLV